MATTRTSELQRRMLRGMVRYRGSKVSMPQLAARMLVPWLRFKDELYALRAKSGRTDLVEWWLANGGRQDAQTQAIIKSPLWQKGGLPGATRQNSMEEYEGQ